MKILQIFLCTLFFHSAFSQEVIQLYEGEIPNSKPTTLEDTAYVFPLGDEIGHFIVRVVRPTITAYFPEKTNNSGKAVIICPGGGYTGLAIDHEGHNLGRKLQANGITGFILTYRLPHSYMVDNKEIVPLQDAQRAIQLVRMRADEWGINPSQVGIHGSSAGGHLASTVATHFTKEYIDNPHNISLRPDFLILNYPVISFADSLANIGTRFNLIGEMPFKQWKSTMMLPNPDEILKPIPVSQDKVIEFSNELHVSENTPPTFISHSIDDKVVPIQNSLLFLAALQQNKVPVESFFYTKGGHGYGIDNPNTQVEWIDSCISWILKLK